MSTRSIYTPPYVCDDPFIWGYYLFARVTWQVKEVLDEQEKHLHAEIERVSQQIPITTLLAPIVIPPMCVTSHAPTTTAASQPQLQVLFAIYCHTLQHTATHCNALQRTATHCNTLQQWQPCSHNCMSFL